MWIFLSDFHRWLYARRLCWASSCSPWSMGGPLLQADRYGRHPIYARARNENLSWNSRNSRNWVIPYLWDEILSTHGQESGILDLQSFNFLVSFLSVFGFKGRRSNKEFVAQDAQTPFIHWIVVNMSFDHLWWKIIQSSAHGLPLVTHCVSWPTEISKFDIVLGSQEDIFRLQIPKKKYKSWILTFLKFLISIVSLTTGLLRGPKYLIFIWLS